MFQYRHDESTSWRGVTACMPWWLNELHTMAYLNLAMQLYLEDQQQESEEAISWSSRFGLLWAGNSVGILGGRIIGLNGWAKSWCLGSNSVSGPARVILKKFTAWQVFGYDNASRSSAIAVFLDLKEAFLWVCGALLWHCLLIRGVPEKSISLFQSLCANSRSWVRAYDNLSSELIADMVSVRVAHSGTCLLQNMQIMFYYWFSGPRVSCKLF